MTSWPPPPTSSTPTARCAGWTPASSAPSASVPVRVRRGDGQRTRPWDVFGDGAVGYGLTELDTFVRHGVRAVAVVGNDASWSQIAREQADLLHDDVGTVLAPTRYDRVAAGFGAVGLNVATPTPSPRRWPRPGSAANLSRQRPDRPDGLPQGLRLDVTYRPARRIVVTRIPVQGATPADRQFGPEACSAGIGGDLDCRASVFANTAGAAMEADRAQVDNNALFEDGVDAGGVGERGTLPLTGARIGGHLGLRDATLRNPTGPALSAVDLQTVHGVFLEGRCRADGAVHGRDRIQPAASTDDRRLDLQGVPQGANQDNRRAVQVLLRWATPDYALQPYQQFSAAYRARGHEADARAILMQRHDQLDPCVLTGRRGAGLSPRRPRGLGRGGVPPGRRCRPGASPGPADQPGNHLQRERHGGSAVQHAPDRWERPGPGNTVPARGAHRSR